MDYVNEYLKISPFTAKQTPENEVAYERLMDVRGVIHKTHKNIYNLKYNTHYPQLIPDFNFKITIF